jgi:diguanylate cyclase (GGDEF)-like protein/PAS domain S-box-containing protein
MRQEFYRELLDSLADGIYFVDLNKTIIFWNRSAARLSGYSAQEVMGKKCNSNILRHIDDFGKQLCIEGCPLTETMTDGETRDADVYLHHKFGHRLPVTVRVSPMRNESGNIVGAVELFSNNSKNLDMINEIELLRHEILRDALTGIGNRRYAELTLKNLEANMVEMLVPFGVLFVDVDHFKTVNDTWGHEVGDRILRMVAQTLSKPLRSFDVACRWGGDEFLIMVPNVTQETLDKMAHRLRMLVESCWLDHHGHKIAVTASFGGAISRQEETPSSVISRADKQAYMSKEAGRNRVHVENN